MGLVNYGLGCQPPVFVNKVLLTHSHIHLFLYCLWLFLHYTAELSSCNRL